MKTGHLLIICGTVVLVAWLAFLPFRYRVEWKASGVYVSCFYFDCLTGTGGVEHQTLPGL